MELTEAERIWLRDHPELNEKWLQEHIASNPAILGLGDLVLKDKERRQPGAGRLDLLLEDVDSSRRYEVEIQLGRADEKHIIRTIEYWDIERKRYPQYEHCAVIVAEDITSRFLNVIGLFNGAIPLMAIQLTELKVAGKVALVFITVLDELALGLDEGDGPAEVVDRAYWESRGGKATVALADDVLALIQRFAGDLELKYNKVYIGLAQNGQPNNFAIFRPKKKHLVVEVRLGQSDEVERMLENAQLDVLTYDRRRGRYKIRLSQTPVDAQSEGLTGLMRRAYQNAS